MIRDYSRSAGRVLDQGYVAGSGATQASKQNQNIDNDEFCADICPCRAEPGGGGVVCCLTRGKISVHRVEDLVGSLKDG